MDLLKSFLGNYWLCWGVGPVLSANIGFWATAAMLEVYDSICPDSAMISHSKTKTRREALKVTRERIPFHQQFKMCLWTTFGPTAIMNGVLGAVVANYIHPFSVEKNPLLPSLTQFCIHVYLLLLVGDFFLYWGHRVQHMNDFLWKNCHSLHHQLDTPSPISTLYIDTTDATLQGALPLLLAAWIVSPHPVTYYAYLMLRLQDNAMNHSGLKSSPLLDLLTLRFLPMRAEVWHHDSHHKFSNYTTNAKNYGEYFWIWDYLFGTMRGSAMLSKQE